MSRLRHGYTNLTRRLSDGRVEKRYAGASAWKRCEREYACLTGLSGLLPVPDVFERDAAAPLLIVRDVPGDHGQDMIDAGHAREVLHLLGTILARLQQVPPSTVSELRGTGSVIVHGDFGPQNVLIDDHRVTALLDWEFAHVRSPVEDLAWAEWIVRMHHPDHVDALPELFNSSGLGPQWSTRQAAMLDRCVELLRLAEHEGTSENVDLWRDRLGTTETWSE